MKDQKDNRRSFMGKLSLAAISLLGFSSSRKMKIMEDQLSTPEQNPVLEIKPMGFIWDTQDPFLFCVHHEDFFPAGNEEMGPAVSLKGRSLGDDFIIKDGWRMYHGKKIPGFPGHPHRGFETVTVVRKGLVDHADSLGASGRYGEGDVQWMTAGRGVQHSEMFPLLNKDADNPMELFQIWLNLPKKNKMVEPHFKMLWGSSIPKLQLKDENGKSIRIEVMAGSWSDQKAPAPPPDSWAADPHNEVGIFNIQMDPGARFSLPQASKGINRTVYFYTGNQLHIQGKEISSYQLAQVRADVSLDIRNGSEAGKILILQGRPIGEPVISYGPFVMNTKQEIQQAFEDFHATKFGGWPWSRPDQVHDRSAGRFAKHADGRYETGV